MCECECMYVCVCVCEQGRVCSKRDRERGCAGVARCDMGGSSSNSSISSICSSSGGSSNSNGIKSDAVDLNAMPSAAYATVTHRSSLHSNDPCTASDKKYTCCYKLCVTLPLVLNVSRRPSRDRC